MADTSKLKPFNDPRVSLRSAVLNNHTYGYLYSPRAESVPNHGTIILIHGFPDISFGWRYQIPLLTSLGLDVIALDCQGYGRSDAPPSSHLSSYTFKRISDDVATLCRQLHLSTIILGGHDWGGAIVYRVQQRYPHLIRAFFSICTPYSAPKPTYTPLKLITQTSIPNFTYQLQFASGAVEDHVSSPHELRQFLNGMYGGRTPDSQVFFTAEYGLHFDRLASMGKTRLLSDDEMDYYVQEYARHGISGPLNWYRTFELNWLDDYDLFFGGVRGEGAKRTKEEVDDVTKIKGVEVLFVQADKDTALKPFMARKMADNIEKLTWRHTDAGHWALWEKPAECNAFIEEWLKDKVFGQEQADGKSKL